MGTSSELRFVFPDKSTAESAGTAIRRLPLPAIPPMVTS